MFEVINNIEMPPQKRRNKYPFLEIGQGFIVPASDLVKAKNIRPSISTAYRYRSQKVLIVVGEDGNLNVKRIA